MGIKGTTQMKTTPLIAGCGMLLLVAFSLLVIGAAPTTQPVAEVQLSDIAQGTTKVIGYLGMPVGTICTLEGQYYAPPGMSPFKFHVTKINGKEVAIPQDIDTTEIPEDPTLKEITGLPKLEVGKSYRVKGYETMHANYTMPANLAIGEISDSIYIITPRFILTKIETELGTTVK